MNPFTQSTVARPLAKNHPDRRWRRPSHVGLQSKCVALSGPDEQADAHQPDSNAPATGTNTGFSPGQSDQAKGRARGKSPRAALALGICLSLSLLPGMVSKPLLLAGGVAIVSIALPGQALALDINAATIHELQSLKGIGPKTAAMIVDERTRAGDYSSISDLSDRVTGIGPKKAAALQAAGLKVGGGGGKSDTKTKPPQGRQKTK